MSHSAEEKIKILYEDSLREIRELSNRMEAITASIAGAASFVSNAKTALNTENEKLLINAVKEIRTSVDQIIGVQKNINIAAANAARELLMSDGGPVMKLESLVSKQQESLGWLNRAAAFYEKSYVLWPMVISSVIGALIGGACVRFI